MVYTIEIQYIQSLCAIKRYIQNCKYYGHLIYSLQCQYLWKIEKDKIKYHRIIIMLEVSVWY